METQKIELANYLIYGVGDFLGADTIALAAARLLYFYTTFCGLTPIKATFIFTATHMLDAVVSPLMGFPTDNFDTTWLGERFSRRKFSILFGIPCVFNYLAMWVGEMGFWYYLVAYLLSDMVYTMILVPYGALMSEITDDFEQKTKFSGARISMAQMSAILASFLPGILLTWLGKDNTNSFFYASLVFSVLCAVMLAFVWRLAWEWPRETWSETALRAEAEKQGLTLAQSLNHLVIELSSTLRIRIFRQRLGMYLRGYVAQDVFSAALTYYVVLVLTQEASVASNLLGTIAIFQFITVITVILLCICLDPAPSYRMVMILFGLNSLSYTLLYYAGLSDVYSLLLLVSAIAELGCGGINYVPWNTYTYIVNVDGAITGQRREGIFAGIMTLTHKASQTGAVMLVDVIVQLSGFVSGQKVQPPGVSHTILLVLSVDALVVLACDFLISLRFRFDPYTHSIPRSETLGMRNLGSARPEQTITEHRTVVEMLAGMPYDCLWGNNNIGYLNRHKPAAPGLTQSDALNSAYTRG